MNSKTESAVLNQLFSKSQTAAFTEFASHFWRAREESNLRHPAPEAGALSTELLAHYWGGRGDSNPQHLEPQSSALTVELRPP